MGTKYEVKNTGVVDFQQSGTEQLVIEQGTSDPGSGAEGQIFYRTDTEELKIHDGTSFQPISAVAGGWQDTGVVVKLVSNTDQVQFGAGTVDVPSISFEQDIDSGLFSSSADSLAFVTGGVQRMQIGTSGIEFNFSIFNHSGTASVPSYTFTGDGNTGFSNPAADTINVITGGALRFDFSDTIQRSYTQFEVTSGQFIGPVLSATFPTYTFNGDENTGMFSSTADVLAFSVGGIERLTISEPDGYASFLMAIRTNGGTALLPTYTFNGDENTGMFSAGGDILGFATGGTSQWVITSAGDFGTQNQSDILCGDGSSSFPSYRFNLDNDTGMYRPGDDILGFAVGGMERLTISEPDGYASFFMAIRTNGGTELLPTYTFNGDENTGMYRVGPDQMGFSANGTRQFTSGITGLTVTTFLNLPNGSAIAPPLRAAADTDTGIFFGANEVKFATNGVQELLVQNGGVVAASSFQMPNGTVGAPGIRLTNSVSTGLYRIASDNLGITAGGTRAASFTATGVDLLGTTTNDSASAGDVGERITSAVVRSSPISTVIDTAKTVTSISLTAGDWDIQGSIGWRTQAGTTTEFFAAINTTTNAIPTGDTFSNFGGGLGVIVNQGVNVASGRDWGIALPTSRVSLSGTTTIYLVQQTDIANDVYGYIEARRVR